MKKMKGIAVMESSPYALPEDPRIRYKHQTLMQDYQDLEKETNAMKKKMEMLKQHKFTLLAEVQFLRRRCKYLMENQLSSPQQTHTRAKRKNIEVKSDSHAKARNTVAKGPAPGKSASALDLNKKGKVKNGRKAALQNPMPLLNAKEERTIVGREAAYHNSARSLDLNERDLIASGREVAIQTPTLVFDLHHKERLRAVREVTKRNPTPVFDLNQISTEELQINDQQPRTEEVHRSLGAGEGEELNNDVKLSSFRSKNTANGLSKVGKRKISWQDQEGDLPIGYLRWPPSIVFEDLRGSPMLVGHYSQGGPSQFQQCIAHGSGFSINQMSDDWMSVPSLCLLGSSRGRGPGCSSKTTDPRDLINGSEGHRGLSSRGEIMAVVKYGPMRVYHHPNCRPNSLASTNFLERYAEYIF